MNQQSSWEDLAERLKTTLEDDGADEQTLDAIVRGQEPADLALALEELDDEQAARIFSLLDDECAAAVLSMLAPDLSRDIVEELDAEQFRRYVELLPEHEAASLLAEQSRKTVEVAEAAPPGRAGPAAGNAQAMTFPRDSAGRMMTSDFIRLRETMTIAQALQEVRSTDPGRNFPADMFVVEPDPGGSSGRERLLGVISIRDAVMAAGDEKIGDLMEREVLCVQADTESTSAARLVSKHKFLALPVTDGEGFLLGVIPSEDLMQVTIARLYQRYARAVGTDAAAMEQMSPAQAAMKRVPWLLGTLVIELGAAVLINHFDEVLMQVILLAAFMPVISAVSGNAGLQAAAITVRGLDSGEMSLRTSRHTLVKETSTTLFMALICGGVLGLIGGFWSSHFMFGVVIALALICSMMTASFMGTLFPLISKRLGFDPATTAGPFETAFQDVIGFGVFLGLATLLSGYL